jgi:hypothetical protein
VSSGKGSKDKSTQKSTDGKGAQDKRDKDKPDKGKPGKGGPAKGKPAKDKSGKGKLLKTLGQDTSRQDATDKRGRLRGPDDRRSASPPAPTGQRLYDMPYSAAPPRLINLDLGLHNLVSRAGHNAGYTIDVTLLDAPDHRLIRSGVLLAHRVLDGRGEWYLGAAEWQPMLPAERIEPMGQADLPEDYADLTRPFRRRATLGPVAGLTCERREFALRDDHGTTMALLRDDKVTVRRGGLTTARYREVMLTPTGPGLTDEQSAHVQHRSPRVWGRTRPSPSSSPTCWPPGCARCCTPTC